MKTINVFSEIGKLKKVLVHRPGYELENLTPQWLDFLLFDEIPWLELAQKEHDAFVATLRKNDTEVYYLTDLIVETLEQNPELKIRFIRQFLTEANITSQTLHSEAETYLHAFTSTRKMIEKTMAGISKNDIPDYQLQTLNDYTHDYPFITDPMPNLYFTRDPSNSIGSGLSVNRMFTHTRYRETIYTDYIFRYHPEFKKANTFYYERNYPAAIEGGDVLVLSDAVLAVGISQRTKPGAIEILAKNIFFNYDTTFTTVLAFDLPKARTFMHLDTLFTQVDYNKFTMHSHMHKSVTVYELTKNPDLPGRLKVKPIKKHLSEILKDYLNREITLIPCGGDDKVAADREQWSDGANTVAMAPGEVIVYEEIMSPTNY